MIWSGMAANGVGEMVLCEGRMNSEKYTNILERAPSITRMFGDTNSVEIKFQQDNVTCHSIKLPFYCNVLRIDIEPSWFAIFE